MSEAIRVYDLADTFREYLSFHGIPAEVTVFDVSEIRIKLPCPEEG